MLWKLSALILLAVTAVQALQNGLIRTPPMGWQQWERFRCNVDCKNDPDNCVRYECIFKRLLLVSRILKKI